MNSNLQWKSRTKIDEYERELVVDRNTNMNNTILIVDEGKIKKLSTILYLYLTTKKIIKI